MCKLNFICDINTTLQSYLGKWKEIWISAMVLLKLWEKGRKMRDKWCDGRERERKKVIVPMLRALPYFMYNSISTKLVNFARPTSKNYSRQFM